MRTPCLLLTLLACTAGDEVVDNSEPPTPRTVPAPTFADAPARVVGVGDVHGDLDAARKVLRKIGATDGEDRWIGGDLVVVQTGDQLDRGDGERAILDLYARLEEEAHAAGGEFYVLLGNHEVMNVELDYRYVTSGGWDDFADVEHDTTDPFYDDWPEAQRGRVAAFRPGGQYAQMLADRNITMVVNDTVFVHGGILPDHVEHGLEKINRETRKWMKGQADYPAVLSGDDSPIWSRHYSDEPSGDDCDLLGEALADLGVTRMVVGHTVQDAVTSACDERVWLVDVGMAAYYGGSWGAVEIIGHEAVPLP